MNYHNITTDDMLNGDGLRVVLWVAGCDHMCHNCQNPITWKPTGGIPFDINAEQELFSYLEQNHIDGVTFSGGDPLNSANVEEVYRLVLKIREKYGNKKSIWIYTGYTFENLMNKQLLTSVDFIRRNILYSSNVLVDGRFVESLADENYPWAGSTNQRVIDLQGTFELLGNDNNSIEESIVLWK